MSDVNRRSFLASAAASGGVLTLGFAIPFGPPAAQASDASGEVTAWVVIRPDDAVIIRIAKSEMGQGILTSLAMLVAEELACDWGKVTTEFAPPHQNLARNRVWGDMSTGGSRSIRTSHDMLRKAGATAREMLVAAAAAQWNVRAAECRAQASVITHVPGGRTVGFGKVAAAAAGITPPTSVALKPTKDWTLIGKPTRRLDVADKVQGKTLYGIDVHVPDMLHAALIQCPVFKGTLKSVDDSKLADLSGVRKVVRLPDAVAVVADTWWQAKKAADVLTSMHAIVWDDGGNGTISSDGITDFLRTGLAANDAGIGRKDGDVASALAQSARRIEAEYSVPFLAHATMEPQNCTVRFSGDQVEVWVPTQNGELALLTAAKAAGVPPRNVIIHKTMLGGGFGRRGVVHDFIPPAVAIAKEMGAPVKTVWTREEDMQHDCYRPVAMARMKAGLDADGMPVAWHVRLSGHSIQRTFFPMMQTGVDKTMQEGFLDDMPYAVPNYVVDYAMRNTHVPVGFWRSVNHSQNGFFKECFIDELAHAAKRDPYHFRRHLMRGNPKFVRLLAALDAAAEKAQWDSTPPAGSYRGIAACQVQETPVAAVAEVSVDATGVIRTHRMTIAIDLGHVVNPLTVEQQIESGVAYGLSAALYGEITIRDGRVEQSNFHDYRAISLAEMPRVDSVVLQSGGFWGGCGEPPVAVVAPALCNAIFAATGKRVRALPLKNHDLRKA
jgi:isoquinoline 1-oxidoreductase beta subunit